MLEGERPDCKYPFIEISWLFLSCYIIDGIISWETTET